MEGTLALVSIIVVVALIFDFTNGFHDAANAIATAAAWSPAGVSPEPEPR